MSCVVCARAPAGTALTTVRVASGLVRPIGVMHAPGDYERVFVIEKQGRIRVLRDTDADGDLDLLATAFLDIDAIVGGGGTTNDERGLLGLAFHPDYQSNGFFYVNYTDTVTPNDTVVAKYQVSADPDVAIGTAVEQVIMIGQPDTNHNGGWMAFGPNDGYLYIAMGDGGGACDPGQRAQNLNELLGKMLRLDVNGDDFPGDAAKNYAIPPDNPFVGVAGLDEIWAYGLRNPWRNAFDSATGDLYIADVGQGQREEINFQPASSSGGENYGWDCREGTQCSTVSGCTVSGCVCTDPGFTDPFHEYTHAAGCSITGGEVYRGCAIPDLRGTYFFADYCTDTIWSLRYDGVAETEFTDRTAELDPPSFSILSITSFGTDAAGEIYICDQDGGEVFKIVPNGPVDCPGDADGDRIVENGDLQIVLDSWSKARPDPAYDVRADFNCDGTIENADLQALLDNWAVVCAP
jgi:glucose/arabinose dehydrogenase